MVYLRKSKNSHLLLKLPWRSYIIDYIFGNGPTFQGHCQKASAHHIYFVFYDRVNDGGEASLSLA